MLVRVLIALAVLAVGGAFTLWWRRREGRFTEGHGRFDRADLGLERRARPAAVLVEFSGEGCAPCVVVRRRIDAIAAEIPGVEVISIDAGEHLDIADRYGVKRVPTLFVADGDLRIIWRASGAPGEDAIRAALLGPDWAGRPRPAHETSRP